MSRRGWQLGFAAAMALGAPSAAGATDDPGPAWLKSGRDVRGVLEARVDAGARRPVDARIRETIRAMHPAYAQGDWGANRIVHYEGDVAIDEYNGRISGTVLVESVMSGAGYDLVYFVTLLPVTAVTDVDGNPLPFEAKTIQDYPFTLVTLPRAAADGEHVSVVMTLDGHPDCGETGGSVSVQLCGWGKANYIGGMTFLPFGIAEPFATMDLHVTVKKGMVLASSGSTVATLPGPDAGHEVLHVVQDFPTDTRSFALAPYQVSQVPWGDKWLRLYLLNEPNLQKMAGAILSDMGEILSFFSDRYGPFLFPKMEAAQITNDAGAAFGWPALLWIPDSMFVHGAGGWGDRDDQRAALFAHELAHQWYPDILKNNDSDAAWLSEGFSEYSSVSFMEGRLGTDYLQGTFDHYGMLYQWLAARRPADDYALSGDPLSWYAEGFAYQIVTYYKGAVVARILENVMGRDRFLAALRSLHDDVGGKDAYYNTYTLRKKLEEFHGAPLDWLFNQWIYRKGFPTYTVDVIRTTTTEGRPAAKVRVRRGSSDRNNVFTMPVRLRLVTEAGDEDHDEWIDQDDMTFTYELGGPLARLRLDPDRSFIKKARSGLPGDADLSGEVDGIDLVYTAWAQDGDLGWSENYLPMADLNGDWAVNGADLDLVTSNFASMATDGEVTP